MSNTEQTPLVLEKRKQKIAEIDEEIQAYVKYRPRTAHFLETLQTISLCDGKLKITSSNLYYIYIFLFFLPALYSSLVVTFASSSPAGSRLFFDGCTNASNTSDPSQPVPFSQCEYCNGGQPWVYANATQSIDTEKVDRLKWVAVGFSILSSVIACAIFSRLIACEFMALRLLSHGLYVSTPFSLFQFVPFIIALVFLLVTSGLDVAVAIEYSHSLLDIQIPVVGKEQQQSGLCNGKLITSFDSGNPSLGQNQIQGFFDYCRAICAALLPFLPVLLKLFLASSTTFTFLSLDDLMHDAPQCRDLFEQIAYEADEEDLMCAIEEYSRSFYAYGDEYFKETCEVDQEAEQEEPLNASSKNENSSNNSESGRHCSCTEVVHRLVQLNFDFRRPVAQYFGFSWATGAKDVQRVCTILRLNGKLRDYRPKVERLPPTPPPGSRKSSGLMMIKTKHEEKAEAAEDEDFEY